VSRPFEVGERAGQGELSPCVECGSSVPTDQVDDAGWCHECRRRLEHRTRTGQRLIAGVITLAFLAWILAEGTGDVLPLYAWALPLLAAWYLGSRIGRVISRNVLRSRRAR